MKIALLVPALCLPLAATAHDFWVEPASEAYSVRYGHRGGDLLPIDAGRLRTAKCLRAHEGGASDVVDLLDTARVTPKAVTFHGRCAALSIFHDGGFWSLTPDGERNLPKDRVPDAVKSWASRQFAKWIDVHAPASRAPLGDEFEIVPVTDLAKAHVGDKVTLRVLSRGQPVPSALLAIDHRPLGETDSKGEVRLRLRAVGITSVSASIRRPLASPKADAMVLEASLTFEALK